MCLDLDLVAGHRIGVRPVVLAVIYLVSQVPFSVQPPFTFHCLKTWLVCISGSVLFAAIRLNFPGKERERLERSVSLSLSLSLSTIARGLMRFAFYVSGHGFGVSSCPLAAQCSSSILSWLPHSASLPINTS